ncbi:MAG: hypothetical protein ISR64_01815 [Deltaproteobacteria bacterium]|nr:hypothetical protein [Deltaproteobacteria bacterium]
MKNRMFLFGVTLIAVAAIAGCKEKPKKAGEPGAPAPKAAATGEKVEVAFHVMSQCPFGVQVENGIAPVLKKIGDNIDFKLEFIGNEKDGKLTSMHGDSEVQGNILQLCSVKHAPDKYMDVILCMNKNMRGIPGNFDACADETKVDKAKIKACADGEEGKGLLSASYKRSQAKGARGSPTIFLAGEKYRGGRQEAQFMRAICNKFKGEKPAACKDIPEPKKIALKVLTDKRCKECYPDRIVKQLKNMFPGLDDSTLDYGTPEGKKLYDAMASKGVKMLPAFLFDPIVAEDPGFNQIKRFAKDAGEYKLLQIGAKFDPTAEICDNKADDDANGKIDCDDPGCKGQLVCRPVVENNLKLFIMSMCPFGVKAGNAMKEVLDAFGKDMNFELHFIADETAPGQFKALHGPKEVAENIRQLCAAKYYPKNNKFMDYIWCRNDDYKSADWEPCAKKAKMDAGRIKKCSEGEEGKKLHSEDIKIAKALGIGASPSWLANNKFKFSGLAPEQIKTNFCSYNKGAKGCAKTLTSDVKGPQGGCGQ